MRVVFGRYILNAIAFVENHGNETDDCRDYKDKMTPICEKLSLKSKFSNVVILAKSETTINK